MFRYRLRTLLLLLAVGPVVIYYLAMRHAERVDVGEQLKDKQTRSMLEQRRIEMERWLRMSRAVPLTDEQMLVQWNRLLMDDNGRLIRDAWGRPLTVGFRGLNNDVLYAKSNGIDGNDDGFGDLIRDDIEVHFWLPMLGIKRSDSSEPGESQPSP